MVTLEPLHRKLLSHYHDGLFGDHVCDYKTLFCLKLRFFLHAICDEVMLWVKYSAHGVSYNVWCARMIEIHFYWPITTLFWIMHVDHWSPDQNEYRNDQKGYLLNRMCNIIQSILSSPTVDITVVYLSWLYTAYVVLAYSKRSIVTINDGVTFKGALIAMRKSLGLSYWCSLRWNHKLNSVEWYQRSFNRKQAIYD